MINLTAIEIMTFIVGVLSGAICLVIIATLLPYSGKALSGSETKKVKTMINKYAVRAAWDSYKRALSTFGQTADRIDVRTFIQWRDKYFKDHNQ